MSPHDVAAVLPLPLEPADEAWLRVLLGLPFPRDEEK